LFLFFFFFAEVATEKAQQAVLKGVEDFDPSQLKHAETQEKIILPDAEGNVVVVAIHIVVLRCVFFFLLLLLWLASQFA